MRPLPKPGVPLQRVPSTTSKPSRLHHPSLRSQVSLCKTRQAAQGQTDTGAAGSRGSLTRATSWDTRSDRAPGLHYPESPAARAPAPGSLAPEKRGCNAHWLKGSCFRDTPLLPGNDLADTWFPLSPTNRAEGSACRVPGAEGPLCSPASGAQVLLPRRAETTQKAHPHASCWWCRSSQR